MKVNYQTVNQLEIGQGFNSSYSSSDECTKFQDFALANLRDLSQLVRSAIVSTNMEIAERPPCAVRRNTHPTGVSDRLAGLLSSKYGGNYIEASHGRFGLYYPDECTLFFKKFNDNLMPQNVRTKNVRDLESQLSLPIGNVPLVFIGYRVNKDNEYVGTYASYIKGKLIWTFDFKSIDNEGSALNVNGYQPIVNGGSLVIPKTKSIAI